MNLRFARALSKKAPAEVAVRADERRKTLDQVAAYVRAHIEPALTILPPPFNVHLASHFRVLAEEIEAMKTDGASSPVPDDRSR